MYTNACKWFVHVYVSYVWWLSNVFYGYDMLWYDIICLSHVDPGYLIWLWHAMKIISNGGWKNNLHHLDWCISFSIHNMSTCFCSHGLWHDIVWGYIFIYLFIFYYLFIYLFIYLFVYWKHRIFWFLNVEALPFGWYRFNIMFMVSNVAYFPVFRDSCIGSVDPHASLNDLFGICDWLLWQPRNCKLWDTWLASRPETRSWSARLAARASNWSWPRSSTPCTASMSSI